MVGSSHRMYKEEDGRQIAAVEAFQVAEKSIKDLKAKFTEEERERKKKVMPLSWKVLRGKQRGKGCCSAMSRTNWPPLGNRYLL